MRTSLGRSQRATICGMHMWRDCSRFRCVFENERRYRTALTAKSSHIQSRTDRWKTLSIQRENKVDIDHVWIKEEQEIKSGQGPFYVQKHRIQNDQPNVSLVEGLERTWKKCLVGEGEWPVRRVSARYSWVGESRQCESCGVMSGQHALSQSRGDWENRRCSNSPSLSFTCTEMEMNSRPNREQSKASLRNKYSVGCVLDTALLLDTSPMKHLGFYSNGWDVF